MFYIKFVNLILIIIVCSYIGMYKASSFNKRLVALRNFKSGLVMFKTKIEFTYEPLSVIFKEISKVIYLDSKNVFKTFCEKIEKTNDATLAWQDSVDLTDFLDGDKEIIKLFGNLLGKTDKNGQISEVEVILEFIEKQIEEAIVEKNKNEKMYKTLGVVCGITIALILV